MTQMIDRKTLANWSQAPKGADRYLRPFVCRGKLGPDGAAIVGLNPATPIGPADIEFPRYLELLLDIEAFTTFYEGLREKRKKKTRSSPTRRGINRIARLLSDLGWTSVLDTNVSPYPTARKEDLDHVPEAWQSRGVFEALMRVATPSLVILHGEDALQEFTARLAPQLAPPEEVRFTDLVGSSPYLGQVHWEGGGVGEVFVGYHLRFFGNSGGVRHAPLTQALEARYGGAGGGPRGIPSGSAERPGEQPSRRRT